MSEVLSAEERYLIARQSSDLSHGTAPCDADKLLAASYATQGNERKVLALDVYGVLAATDMRGARNAADRLSRYMRRGSARKAGKAVPRVLAFDICLQLMKVWHQRTCFECKGRGHPLMLNAPVLDETRLCPVCHGSGLLPLERIFRHEHVKLARQIEGEITHLCAEVFDDMARILSNRMEMT